MTTQSMSSLELSSSPFEVILQMNAWSGVQFSKLSCLLDAGYRSFLALVGLLALMLSKELRVAVGERFELTKFLNVFE